ncbi:glycosyltransferase [Pedobacter metabolipauper]|uniref:Cellulose synthase/poly-beta-1,6-N-acetylglucosamine synthase-like glycosyltransferase n=1 Tax=Pedobacter metabolipauper TaxID=425513 RepID=A0A4R6T3A1_9SPHI|nr:glycosyltransferase [Pedobacter metabolipauper]TDQ12010.1 cellulose synthase/poly-beta-1,6-N-acetylglucosamine synthase-like glycosyltransferase [Pedobacter metabolipauper]
MAAFDLVYGFLHLIELIVGFNLIFPLFLFICWKIKSKKSSHSIPSSDRDYAIIITAYEQTDLVPDVVNSILATNYSNYTIYVVADHCSPSDNLVFTDERVKVLFPEVVLASNIKSHFYAITNFIREHEVLLIMDSDNLADPGLMVGLNIYFDLGFDAVQGVRAAKNLNSTIANLDAARDIYYHFYDGKILFELGSSATLSGSGMAFKTDLYRQVLENTAVKGAGFDKVLQAQILKLNKRIAFSDEALVYDQKTATSKQLVNQRSRWINTWFRFFKFGFGLVTNGIKNFSLNQFLFGIILLRPPLFMFLSMAFLLIFLNLFINPVVSVILSIAFLIFILSFLIALSNSKTDKRIYQALRFIPVFIFYQFVSLVKSMIPNERNVATKHDHQKK